MRLPFAAAPIGHSDVDVGPLNPNGLSIALGPRPVANNGVAHLAEAFISSG